LLEKKSALSQSVENGCGSLHALESTILFATILREPATLTLLEDDAILLLGLRLRFTFYTA